MNPVLEPFPDDILPEGLVHVNPPSDCCETAVVVVVVWVWPSLGEVKGERRGGGWTWTGEDVCTSSAGGTVFIGDVMAFGFGRSAALAATDMMIGRGAPTSIPSGELLPDSLPESSESLLDDELELLLEELDLLRLTSGLLAAEEEGGRGGTRGGGGTPVAITGTDPEVTVLTKTPPTLPTLVVPVVT